MSFAQSSPEARRSPREAIDCPSRIWSAGEAPVAALIVNISPHGCMVRSDRSIPIGQCVIVAVPGVGDLRGLVIWSLGARIGLEFEHQIALEPYLAMLASVKLSSDEISK